MDWHEIARIAELYVDGYLEPFQAPAVLADIALLRQLRFPFPEEYLSLFESHHGQGTLGFLEIRDAMECKSIFDGAANPPRLNDEGVPLPSSDCPQVAQNDLFPSGVSVGWMEDWFPFYGTGESTYYTFDFLPSSMGSVGQILLRAIDGEVELIAPSFSEWMKMYVRVLLGDGDALPVV